MPSEYESERKNILVPKDGSVIVTVETDVTEQEIVEERESIVQRLHMGYMNLVEDMQEFQQQWDADGKLSLLTAAYEGVRAGGGAWWDDFDDIFEKEIWIDLGDKVKNFAGETYDRTAVYSKKVYTRLIVDRADTIYTWNWWGRRLIDVGSNVDKISPFFYLQKKGMETLGTVAISAGKSLFLSQKIYIHRAAILNLPTLIASGDTKGIEAFVDQELKDIDAEFAKAIKTDPNFPLVLEVIQDQDSALTYVTYMSLMIEAVPPNFYVYVAAKGGVYLLIEVVLLIVTALLSAGTAAAARIATLVARLATTSVKTAVAGNKIKKGQAAISAMGRMLQDFSDAADNLHKLGYKLQKARSKGLVLTGSTKTTLTAKKDNIKRDKKCRLCGSTAHATPRYRLGTVVYK